MSALDDAIAQIYRALPITETTALPVLFVFSGLPGTGKSFLARSLAERLPSVIVQSDFVRKTLVGIPTYSAAESAFIHQVSHAVIARLLARGCRVISDATNLAEWHREKLYRVAADTHAQLVVVRTVAPDAVIRARLSQRIGERDPRDFSDADWNVYEMLQRELEPVRAPHLVVDTSGDLDAALAKILRAIR
ncbi:MAG: AAA family ATPase [Chloroflexi bacterium]|nr:AAA family ATPase [Chloroflexota bacterium]